MKYLLLAGIAIECLVFTTAPALPTNKIVVRIKAPVRYQHDHSKWFFSGKAFIWKECPWSYKIDPGEASCRMTWGEI